MPPHIIRRNNLARSFQLLRKGMSISRSSKVTTESFATPRKTHTHTATPIKRITTAYDTRIYTNHRLQAASAIQPVDCPRKGERLLSPPFQHFHAEGLTTTYTLRRRAHISGQSLALRTDSARRTNISFDHASVDKTTPVLQARPTLDVAWVESITTGVTPQISTPLTGELQRIQNRRVVLGTNTDHTDLLRRAARRSSTTTTRCRRPQTFTRQVYTGRRLPPRPVGDPHLSEPR